jgi:hypothetical protein
MSTKYLLVIWNDLEIEKLGPYSCEPERSKAARAVRAEEGDEHGIHWLDVHEDGIEVGDYPGGFFDDPQGEIDSAQAALLKAAKEIRDGWTKNLTEPMARLNAAIEAVEEK